MKHEKRKIADTTQKNLCSICG